MWKFQIFIDKFCHFKSDIANLIKIKKSVNFLTINKNYIYFKIKHKKSAKISFFYDFYCISI